MPGPLYRLPAPQNWNSISSVEIEISTDPTFATFPAKKSLNQFFPYKPPVTICFSTNYPGTYYFRARVSNSLGQSPWTPALMRAIP